MQLELPLAALLIARLPDASMQMLAFGSLAYPLAVVAESPSYMLTSLGTVKGMHGGAFARMLRFSVMVAMLLAGALSVVAFTPLFDMLAANVMRVPATTVPEARLALQVLLPVVLMNAVRWFFQGVLVQYTHEGWIGIGTTLRVGVCASAMTVGGYLVQTGRVQAPGAVVAACAVLCGSFTHCLYGVIRCRQVRRLHRATLAQEAQACPEPWVDLMWFYAPLALTALIDTTWEMLVIIGVSRSALPLESLAVWPVVYGFVKLLVCAAQAYLPIVERSSHAPTELQRQKRFAWWMGLLLMVPVLACALPWVGAPMLGGALKLDATGQSLAIRALWWMLPLPLIGFATAYAQARLIRVNRPGALTEGILVATIALFAVISVGVMTASWTGAQVGAMAMLLGAAAEYVWLLLRVRTACTHASSPR